jgi:uncharacterized membrane protein YbhN (UPF0104 family)
VLVALGLLSLLFATVDLRDVIGRLRDVHPLVFALLLGVNTSAYVLFALRWGWFCRRLGLPHSFGGRLRGIYLFQVASQVTSPILGEFGRFLVFPPGTKKADIVKSIALDRLSNQIALAVAVTLLLPYYYTQDLPGWLRVVLPVPALVVVVLVLVSRRLTSFLRLLAAERFGLVPLSLGLALTAVLALEFQLAAVALPLSSPAPATLFLFVPALTLAVSLAPISFGDWGTRELAALIVLAPTGLAAEDLVAISLLVGVTNLAASLPGLVLLVRSQRSVEKA